MNVAPRSGLSPMQSPLLAEAGGRIAHGFFGRKGGVSEGSLYAGLNVGLGSKDDPDHIRENRARVANWFGTDVDHLATLYQIHSPDVVTVTEAPTERAEADGHVTDQPGIVLGILTADCGPVLFADAKAGVIGAAHAGWKGAFTGVLENTIEAMVRLGADRENIVASLGPSIAQDNYEVGPEFVERFTAVNPGWAKFFIPSAKPGHSMFDLPGLTVSRLEAAGVRAENLDICTYADEENYFSYRRTTHRQEPDYGRQISAIMLREN